MTADCIDLKAAFPDCRISYDPAADSDRDIDPWMRQIPCRLGTVYPHGGDKLACEVNNHPAAARRLRAMAGVVCTQDGGNGGDCTFVFDVSRSDAVFTVVQPSRKRRCSPETLARLREAAPKATAASIAARATKRAATEFALKAEIGQ